MTVVVVPVRPAADIREREKAVREILRVAVRDGDLSSAGFSSDAHRILAGAIGDMRGAARWGKSADRQDSPGDWSWFVVDLYLRSAFAADGDPIAARATLADHLRSLDDRAAYLAGCAVREPLTAFIDQLDQRMSVVEGAGPLSCIDVIALARACVELDAFRAIADFGSAVVAEDEARRYEIQDVLISARDGARISALVVRPRIATPLPTLLEYTIYTYPHNFAREAASRGFGSVLAYSRGKGASPDPITPFEHDGADAAAVIDWIAAQPWSDGRVGMYGGSYSGFTQWAAARHRPAALRAIAASASAAPGIDIPVQAGIFQNFFLPWARMITESAVAMEPRTQEDVDAEWFRSGRSYREIDEIAGQPNPFVQRWLEHPVYDDYWQRMIPVGKEFADIDIPVLATTGYGDGGQVGVLHYFREHHAHRPGADHTLVVGPFDHIAMQRGVQPELGGYTVDPVASVALRELRYEWFDHIFRGAPRPTLLASTVNFQVMGSDRWAHAASVEEMSSGRVRSYLSGGRLAESAPEHGGNSDLIVDLTDRSSSRRLPNDEQIVFTDLDFDHALAFEGPVFADSWEMSGIFAGMLDVAIDRRDVDLSVELYERRAAGGYLRLLFHRFRASLSADRGRRQLLDPGRPTALTFRSERITSRRLEAGGCLIAIVRVILDPGMQINYGTGADVSDETIEDAESPLLLTLGSGSYLEFPQQVQSTGLEG
jgi:predicted acyl esterase